MLSLWLPGCGYYYSMQMGNRIQNRIQNAGKPLLSPRGRLAFWMLARCEFSSWPIAQEQTRVILGFTSFLP